jgi:hypothetical protein
LIAILAVVAVAGIVAANVISNHISTSNEAKRGCTTLIEMLKDPDMTESEIWAEAPVRVADMEEHFREQCPKAMSKLDAIDDREVEAPVEEDPSTNSDPGESDGRLGSDEPSLLEKQCYAASEIVATGNGPGSPYSDYTDEDIEDSENFLAANCN